MANLTARTPAAPSSTATALAPRRYAPAQLPLAPGVRDTVPGLWPMVFGVGPGDLAQGRGVARSQDLAPEPAGAQPLPRLSRQMPDGVDGRASAMHKDLATAVRECQGRWA